MIPLEKVKEIITKHNELEKELSSGNVDPKLFDLDKHSSARFFR